MICLDPASVCSGRMPLAYVQLVQILTDLLILTTPLALYNSVGGVGAVIGTGVVTLFHSSVVKLAKIFLDPFNNEVGADLIPKMVMRWVQTSC